MVARASCPCVPRPSRSWGKRRAGTALRHTGGTPVPRNPATHLRQKGKAGQMLDAGILIHRSAFARHGGLSSPAAARGARRAPPEAAHGSSRRLAGRAGEFSSTAEFVTTDSTTETYVTPPGEEKMSSSLIYIYISKGVLHKHFWIFFGHFNRAAPHRAASVT